MTKRSMWLGALVGLVMPSLAAAQTPPPSVQPPQAGAWAATVSEDAEEPPRPASARSRSAGSDAPLPRGEGPPPEEVPELIAHRGATFELSLGLGITHVSLDGGLSDWSGGLSGLNLGLGGWVTSRTALTLRLASTSFFERVWFLDIQIIAGMLGLSIQHMVSDRLWVGGGAGVGVLTTSPSFVEPAAGFTLDLRAGVNFYQSKDNAFHLAVEATPGFFDGRTVTGFGFQLGWQSL